VKLSSSIQATLSNRPAKGGASALVVILILSLRGPIVAAQDVQLIQEMQDLLQQMEAAKDKDICPFMPRMRALVRRLMIAAPEMYQATKEQFDEFERVSAEPCSSSPSEKPMVTPSVAPVRRDAPAEPDAQEKPPSLGTADVRRTTQQTRSLADEELSALRKVLRYAPPRTSLRIGAPARTVLQDDADRVLAAITVQWIKSERPLMRTTRPGTPPAYGVTVGYFRIKLENFSDCLFDAKATLVIPGSLINAEAVNLIVWDGWVALRQPDRGQTTTFEVSGPIGDYQELVLAPQRGTESLSQCRTPQR